MRRGLTFFKKKKKGRMVGGERGDACTDGERSRGRGRGMRRNRITSKFILAKRWGLFSVSLSSKQIDCDSVHGIREFARRQVHLTRSPNAPLLKQRRSQSKMNHGPWPTRAPTVGALVHVLVHVPAHCASYGCASCTYQPTNYNAQGSDKPPPRPVGCLWKTATFPHSRAEATDLAIISRSLSAPSCPCCCFLWLSMWRHVHTPQ